MELKSKLFIKIFSSNTITNLMQKSPLSSLFTKRLGILKGTALLQKPRCYSSRVIYNPLYDIPYVKIPNSGEFNYMLIYAYNHGESGLGRFVVRGDKASHNKIVKEAQKDVEAKALCMKPYGGGKMCHDPDKKRIRIFGKSKEYGKADRENVKEVLLKKYRRYKITKK